MSMRDYGINDYGYVFTEEMLEKLIDERFADDLDHDDCEILAERMGLEYISEFTGGAYHLDEKSDDNYNWDTLFIPAIRFTISRCGRTATFSQRHTVPKTS